MDSETRLNADLKVVCYLSLCPSFIFILMNAAILLDNIKKYLAF